MQNRSFFKVKSGKTAALIGSLFLMLTTTAHARDEIKLNCQLSFSKSYSSGLIERGKVDLMYEIVNRGAALFILSDNENFPSVSTTQTNAKIDNFSDEGKWDVRNETIDEKGRKTTRMVRIDRNSGRIVVSHDFRDGSIYIQADGRCSRVDTAKRLF
ncbi:MAG: hypothetical protein WCS09_07140 [Pseudomonadota bacterium]